MTQSGNDFGENNFYRENYDKAVLLVILLMLISAIVLAIVTFQVYRRPLPEFKAIRPDGQVMLLSPSYEPNLLPDTILRFASKAATAAYTFDFNNYKEQLALARPYFSPEGWKDYLAAVRGTLERIVERKLFVNGMVYKPPVISNQGYYPGKGYTWGVEIPLLVTYQSGNMTEKRRFIVKLLIVKVPTTTNPQGIGIDQFTMTSYG